MRNLLLYVVIGIAFLAGILALAFFGQDVSFALLRTWYSFVCFSLLLAAVLVKMYWPVRKSAKVWPLLGILFLIHVGVYVVFLRHVQDWSTLWYLLTTPIEVMIIATIVKICLDVLPPRVKM